LKKTEAYLQVAYNLIRANFQTVECLSEGFVTLMPDQDVPPTIFHMLERNVGKRMRVIVDPAYGFEGTLAAITSDPSGIWLSDAEAIILRATIAQPIPTVTSREERSEIFLHLNSVQRIEVLHPPTRR